MVPLHIKYDVN